MPSRMSGWTAGASAGSAPAGCGPLVAALVMHAEVSETSWIVSGSSLGFCRARARTHAGIDPRPHTQALTHGHTHTGALTQSHTHTGALTQSHTRTGALTR
eukprot:3688857-Prymnesium_polylepis.2